MLDNSASFTSSTMKDLCQKWKAKLISRSAYRLSETGIVECSEIIDVGSTLKQFDGLTWLYIYDPDPIFYDRSTPLFYSVNAGTTVILRIVSLRTYQSWLHCDMFATEVKNHRPLVVQDNRNSAVADKPAQGRRHRHGSIGHPWLPSIVHESVLYHFRGKGQHYKHMHNFLTAVYLTPPLRGFSLKFCNGGGSKNKNDVTTGSSKSLTIGPFV